MEQITVTPALLELSPREFLLPLIHRLNAVAVVEGPDFRFGRRREGDAAMLTAIGHEMGVEIAIVDPVEVVLNDHHTVPARSSVARWLVSHGRVSDACRVLTRNYTLEGMVVRGDRRGRTIGYPTINIASSQLIPADGVYAGRATLPDGRVMAAAISVGTKPTFGNHSRAVEAFLMDPPAGVTTGSTTAGSTTANDHGNRPLSSESTSVRVDQWRTIDGLPEYGWSVSLEFVSFVRDQVLFDDLRPLLEQMDRDCAAILGLVEPRPAHTHASNAPTIEEVHA